MATNKTTVELEVLAKGLDEAIVKAKSLRDIMLEAGKAASSFRVPGAVAAARQGVAASNAGRSTYRAAAAAPAGGSFASDTNLSRGIGGLTGAEGRDFGKQAQGLGGLVHVYATFAANIFAVSAAFNALSGAMDTSNMIKGLDQLGAASGRGLGSLSKQLALVTGNAISMRDAMSATALASAGGMTNSQILRMGAVAKTASQALGVDMTDAINRLSKGIVKIQPELLDELGIMTRVIPAQQEYARSINKSVDDLSTFEKQQAFTTAVLKEGERKFADINIEANAYSKILASLNNISFKGLEALNTILNPIINLLASSPMALTAAIGAFGTMLIKQAIPALGQIRENIKAVQEDSKKRVNLIYLESSQAASIAVGAASASAKAAFMTSNDTIERINKLREAAKSISSGKPDAAGKIVNYGAIAAKGVEASPEELKQLDTRADRLKKSNATEAAIIKNHIDEVNKIKTTAEERASNVEDTRLKKEAKWYTHQSQVERLRDQANQQASAAQIKGLTAETQSLGGPISAWKTLNEQIAISKAGKAQIETNVKDPETGKNIMANVNKTGYLQNGAMRAAGAFTILGAAISTAMSAFQPYIILIGLVIGALGFLSDYFTKNKKESSDFGDSLDKLNTSIDMVGKTLDTINKKKAIDAITIASIQAKATSMGELSDSLQEATEKFDKLKAAEGGWDRFANGFWDMFGKGAGDKLAKGISGSVVSGLKLMEEGPAKEAAKKSLQNLFGADVNLSKIDSVNNSFKDLEETVIALKGKEASKIFSDAARAAGSAAQNLTEFKASLIDINKQMLIMKNALLPTDEFSKLGMVILATADKMGKFTGDTKEGLAALRDLVIDIPTLSLLPPDMAKNLAFAQKQVETISMAITNAERDQADATSKRLDAEKELAKIPARVDPGRGTSPEEPRISRGMGNMEQQRGRLQAEKDLQTQRLQNAGDLLVRLKVEANSVSTGLLKDVANTLNKIGLDDLQRGLTRALVEAGIATSRAILSTIKGASEEYISNLGGAESEAKLQELALQRKDIEERFRNSKAMAELTIAVERNTASNELKSVRDDLRFSAKDSGTGTAEYKELEKKAKALERTVAGASRALEFLDMSDKDLIAERRKLNVTGGTATAANDFQTGKSSDADIAGMAKVSSYITEIYGKNQQLAKIGSETAIANLAKQIALIDDKSKNAIRDLNTDKEKLTLNASILSDLQSISGIYNIQLQTSKEENEIAKLRNQYLIDDRAILRDIEKIETSKRLLTKGDTNNQKKANDAIEAATKRRLTISDKFAKEEGVLISKNQQERIKGLAEIQAIEFANQEKLRVAGESIRLSKVSEQEATLNFLKSQNTATDQYFAAQTANIERDKQTIAFAKDKRNLDQSAQVALTAEQSALDLILAKHEDSYKISKDEQAVIDQKIAKINTLKSIYKEEGKALNSTNDARIFSIALIEKQNKLAADAKDLAEITAAKIGEQRDILNSRKTLGTVSDRTALTGEASIAFAEQKAKYDAQTLGSQQKIAELDAIKLEKGNVLSSLQSDLYTAAQAQLDKAKELDGYETRRIQRAKDLAIEQLRIKDILDEQGKKTEYITSLADSLASAFGNVGTAIGDSAKILDAASIRQQNSSQEIIKLEEQKKNVTGNAKEQALQRVEIDNKIADINKKSTRDQMTDTANLAGSTKKMFAEKTFAYKALAGIEKAIHIMKIAMMIKEMFFDNASTVSKVANDGVKTASTIGTAIVDGAAAVISALKGPPPMNFIMAGAVAAAVSALLSSIGGSGTSKPATGPSAADRQALGSGQAYNASGTLVETGGGVLGDAAAKSKTIQESLEIMKSTSVEGLSDSNKMVELLASIDQGINGVSSSIAGQTGLTKGLGTSVPTDLGVSTNKFLNIGTTTIKDLVDSGIALKGTMQDFIDNIPGAIEGFNNISTTVKNSWLFFSTTSDPFITTYSIKLEDQITTAISNIFKGTGDALKEAGTSLGIDAYFIETAIKTIDISGLSSLKGLTGTALSDAVSKFFNDSIDKVAKASFPGFEKFSQMGEAYGKTIFRVYDDLNKTNQSLLSVGKATLGIGLPAVEVAEALIKKAGGLSVLLEKTKFFADSFLTEAERIAPIRTTLATDLVKLQLNNSAIMKSAPKTREEFTKLIQGLDLNTEAGRKLYISLLDLAPSFDKVTAAEKKLQDVRSGQLVQILELLATDDNGYAQKALTITRRAELDAMDEQNRSAQLYIYALEDEAALKGKLKTSYDAANTAVKATITSLKSSIQSLKDYRQNLFTGDKANLTPIEKYTADKQTFMQLAQAAAVVLGSDATTEQVAARDKALGSLAGASDAFLASSKVVFASSAAYQEDFSSVAGVLNSTQAILETQQTDAEKNLEILRSSDAYLGIIDVSTRTTATLMNEFLIQQRASIAATAASAAAAPRDLNTVVALLPDNILSLTSSIALLARNIGNMPSSLSSAVTTATTVAATTIIPTVTAAVTAGTADTTGIADTTAAATSTSLPEYTKGGQNDQDEWQSRGYDWTGEKWMYIGSDWRGRYDNEYAKGGIAYGQSLVGEQGPELVDFTSPARIYTARDTNLFGDNKAIIKELQELRKELSQLRQDQQEQTGHLITTNYDANIKAAGKVASATEDATEKAVWLQKSVATIK